MYLSFSIYIIASIAAISNCEAEDNLSILSLSGSTATQNLRRSDLIAGQEEESMKQKAQRTLNFAGTGLFKTVSRVLEEDCCCCCDNDNNADDDGGTHSPSSFPTPVPTISASLSPTYIYKKIYASDGSHYAHFGLRCATTDDSIVLGAYGDSGAVGAAYLYNRDGTNEVKLTPGVDSVGNDQFGQWVSMDEKIVVGTGVYVNYFRVYSREGTYENTITCTDCRDLGSRVATLGNKILANAIMNDRANTDKLFIYDIDGVKLKELVFPIFIHDIGISEQFIALQEQDGKTYIYSNSAPDFPFVAEMDQRARNVAVSGDRVVIGEGTMQAAAWLYSTDGSLIKELDHDKPGSFANSLDITDDRVYVGSASSSSIWIYSAATGDFIEEIIPPDGEEGILFGYSVCVSQSFYVVGAPGVSSPDADDVLTGAAYSIHLPLYK